MLDTEPTGGPETHDAPATDQPEPTRRRRTRKATTETEPATVTQADSEPTQKAPPARRTRRRTAAATEPVAEPVPDTDVPPIEPAETAKDVAEPTAPARRTRRRATAASTAAAEPEAAPAPETPPARPTRRRATAASTAAAEPEAVPAPETPPVQRTRRRTAAATEPVAEPVPDTDVPPLERAETATAAPAPRKAPPRMTFVAPTVDPLPARPKAEREPAERAEPPAEAAPEPDARPVRRTRRRTAAATEPVAEPEPEATPADDEDATGEEARRRRRRGRRGRGRGKAETDAEATDAEPTEPTEPAEAESDDEEPTASSTRRRRRRRRRAGADSDQHGTDDPPDTVVHVRDTRAATDEVRAVRGSTRLEAKRQRRRDGRDQGRRRAPILTESEFLARREAVKRTMVVRQRGDRTQIAVLEDDVLVEHYISRANTTSYAGNVYLGRVQNVLPSMEAAFVDIGKGRNAVLYAGEVNWAAAGMEGKTRQIEQALKSGDSVLVQVTKDPIGHKGARLTSQISLAGRYLVYVPNGSMTGISRKLPDTERQRLKDILRRIVPEDAGVIIRTAAEGTSEEDLTRDVARLRAQWEVIAKKSGSSSTSAPALLYAEPDVAIRVVRDVFNEDFGELIVSGDEAWSTLEQYVRHVAPDLAGRLRHHTGDSDVFADHRIDEQLTKAMDRKVWLPSGGSLVIDRTEAMTVIDVNTGKFTGAKGGGSLEETVTRNNLEAAEEIVRQLRLRDIGGMVVIDFIDMVLESNRDLVLRRLTECLGRDRTKHQVAEVTSLGLVQMTRKRVGQGLLETFSEQCDCCKGRGVLINLEPPVDTRVRAEREAPEPEPTPEEVEAAAAEAAGVPEDVAQPAASATEEPVVEPAPRPRRRRAATRPAGPPRSEATGTG